MQGLKLTLFFLFLIFGVSLAFVSEAAIAIDRNMFLTDDIIDENLVFISNDIVLDCNGHRLIGKQGFRDDETNGILVNNLNNVVIKNCVIEKNSGRGVLVLNSSNVTLENNQFKTKFNAIYIESSENIFVHKNNLQDPTLLGFDNVGIFLTYSNKSKIEENDINFFYNGIFVLGSENHVLKNRVSGKNNSTGIRLQGVTETPSFGNVFQKNNIQNLGTGISMDHSENNTISENSLLGNSDGMYIEDANNNMIFDNTIAFNRRGLRIEQYSRPINNFIFHNNIFSNTLFGVTVNFSELKEFSYNREGNFWGHASTPCFHRYGGLATPFDANRSNIVDSHPFCLRDQWKQKPILLLPGMMGSWTQDYDQFLDNSTPPDPRQLQLIEDQRAFIQKPFYGRLNWFIPNTWEELRKTASSTGYRYGETLFDAPYDWRKNNDFNRDVQGNIDYSRTYTRYPHSGWDSDGNILRIDTAPEYLMYWIDRAKSTSHTDKVDIVAHSMGGLVARAYIQSPLYENDIRKLAIVGTPNHGAADSYFLWAGGDPKLGQGFGSGLFLSSWFNQMRTHFGAGLTPVAFTHRFLESVGQLMPVSRFSHEDSNNNRTLDQGEDFNDNNQIDPFPGYLLRLNFVPEFGLFQALIPYPDITTINQNHFLSSLNNGIGSLRDKGVDFKVFLSTNLRTAKFNRLLPDPNTTDDQWRDGEPDSPETFSPSEGDERTLVSSGKLPELDPDGVKVFLGNGFRHVYLPSDYRVEIFDFLRSTQSPPGIPLAEEIKATRALSMYVASPVDILVVDPQGRRVGFDQTTGQEYREIPTSWYTGNVGNEHLVIPDPMPGDYRVLLQGNESGSFTSWATVICDDGVGESVEKRIVGSVSPGTLLPFDLVVAEGCSANAFEYGFPATFAVEPRTLNSASQGNFVTARITFPPSYNLTDVDFSSVRLNNAVPLLPLLTPQSARNTPSLLLKFDRAAVTKVLSPGENTILISGDLLNGTHFFGTTTLNMLDDKRTGMGSHLIFGLLGFAGIRILGLLVRGLV